jgi:hypothetical protein
MRLQDVTRDSVLMSTPCGRRQQLLLAALHSIYDLSCRMRTCIWPLLIVAVFGLFSISVAHAAGAAKSPTAGADIIPPYNPQLDAVKAPTGVFGTGKIWHVGSKQQNKSFAAISRQLQDGDVVEIDSGTYGCTEQSIVWSANNITVIGVDGRATFNATGCAITGDKGIFNPRGTNMIIDNIAFIGVQGPSRNDAGIRLDGGGYVYITNSYFENSQNGVLLTPSVPTNIVIDHSEFSGNGNCLDASGCGHNMYISNPPNADSFVLRFSYSHDANTGHEVKSRAKVNYILYNRLTDEATGKSSYEVDISNGGLTYIVGNIIQKGPNGQNGNVMAYAEEGATNPIQKLYIANNTIVNAYPVPDNRWVLLVGSGVTEANMVNNLIVGLSSSSHVADGPGAGVLQQRHDVITNEPGFFKPTDRNYFLTASSPAVNAGIDPGSVNGFSLKPLYQFQFPASGIARPVSKGLDAGAYQYAPDQVMPQAPVIAFSSNSPVAYDGPVTLTWSSTGASRCTGAGDWSGSQPASGQFTSPALTSSKSYTITCMGAGGTASKSLSVSVNQSPAAAALGTYSWRNIPNSKISGICEGDRPEYKENVGTGPACGGPTTGVYVPDTATWYLMGDAGYTNYYGNEVYGFDLNTLRPVLITKPDKIKQTREFLKVPTNSLLSLSSCNAALHLTSDGSIIRAPSGIEGTASWNPLTKTIVVGQSVVHGIGECAGPSGEFGGYSEDLWSFNPLAFSKSPLPSSAAWKMLADQNNALGSVAAPLWIFDPVTGLAYIAGNRAYTDRGGRLIDFNRTPPVDVQVNANWPYGAMLGAVSVDTTRHWAIVVGTAGGGGLGNIEMWNLNGLSMTKYSARSPFAPDNGWTVTGDMDLLKSTIVVGVTYNPNLSAFVAWRGGSTVYFLYPNYQTKVVNIVGKVDIPDGPPATTSNLYGGFNYISDKNEYLAFSDVRSDFYLLIPPGGASSAQVAKKPSR